MLRINSITRGIVIDHIKPGYGFIILRHLGLDKVDFTVALIMNAASKRQGRKDMIKIENKIDLNLDMLGFMDANLTVNIIEDEKIIEKINLSLPDKVEDIIKCKNPRCITSSEKGIVNRFILIEKETGTYKCEYCDHIYSREV